MLHVLGGPCTNTILRYQASEETKFGLDSFKILGHLSHRLFFIFTWTNISPGIPVLHVQVLNIEISHWRPLCIITLTSIVYHPLLSHWCIQMQKMRSETTLLNSFAHTMQTYTNHILTWQCWSSSSSLHCLVKTHKIIYFFFLLFIYGNKDLSLRYIYVLCLKV